MAGRWICFTQLQSLNSSNFHYFTFTLHKTSHISVFHSLFTNHSHSLFTNYSAFLLACIQHDSALSSVLCNTSITHKFIAFAHCTLDGVFYAFVGGGKFLWIVGFLLMSGDIILWICCFSFSKKDYSF